MSALIMIVDESDRPVGSATKKEAWDQGLIHRIVRIMIENRKGQILLQHRTPTKDIYPNCWDNSVAGHVDAGEEYEQAAVRELREELGLEGLDYAEIGRYRSDETWNGHRFNRFSRVYKIKADVVPARLEEGKIDDARWFSVEDVKQLLSDHPDQVSDGLRQVIERYY